MKTKNILSYLLFSGFVSMFNICVSAEGLADTVMSTYDKSLTPKNSFFSLLSRLRYINRWAILHNCEREDLEHHSFETALIAHALCTIKNVKYGGNLNAEKAAVIAMFHDVSEIVTGDMPSPIKYFDNRMKPLYSDLEENIIDGMLDLISDEEIRKEYKFLLNPSEEDKELIYMVKAADKISAAIKCLREIRLGNNDFEKALEEVSEKILQLEDPAIKYFINTFFPSYGFNLYLNK